VLAAGKHLITMRLIEAVTRSNAEGVWVDLPELKAA
jgi:hypothetical protein